MPRIEIDFEEIEGVASRMADAAANCILPLFRSNSLMLSNKDASGFDPVTEADKAAERAMRDVLLASRPDDAILGEEYGAQNGTSGLTWVLDPIDGTRGFISGTPTWGVLIALSDDQGPRYGMIAQPYIGERFSGSAARARFEGPHGSADLKTRDTQDLSQAIIFTTYPEVGEASEGRAFHAVASQAKLTRYGMDCYAYALLAAGQIDLVIEAGLQSYDIQAPIAVVQAAGGIVTAWDGGPAHNGGRAIAAANEKIHAQALDLLKAALS
ncbi:MAG: histidinol-phosphatase [Roseobacter sp.]